MGVAEGCEQARACARPRTRMHVDLVAVLVPVRVTPHAPGRARRAPAAAQGKVVVRWYDPHLEVMLDGSRGAKIDCARDAANMRVMRLIGHREEDADPGRPKSP